jgi:hypothetical protein
MTLLESDHQWNRWEREFLVVVIVSLSPAINTLLTISGHRSSGASGYSVRELESRHRSSRRRLFDFRLVEQEACR